MTTIKSEAAKQKAAAKRLFPKHRPKRFSKLVCFTGTPRDIQKGVTDLLALLRTHGYIIESATRSEHYIVDGKVINNLLGNLVMVHFAKSRQKQEMWPCWNLMPDRFPTWEKHTP